MRLPFYVDIGRAVFAVALAVLLYFVALSETNPADQRDLGATVPVQPVNVPSGLVITAAPPPVRLRVTAPQNVFARLRADSFTAQVDVSGAHAGDNDLAITLSTTDPDVRAVQPEPATVRLHLEEIREQVLPVRVNSTGQVPPGYQVGTSSVDPARITVAGPASFVSRATEAVVDVSVDRLTVTQTVRVPPSVINLSGAVQLARPLDLVSVTISGPAPALQTLSLNPNDFKVVLDAGGKGPGRYEVDVRVQQVPQGLTLQDFSPRKVQVDLSLAPPPPTPTLAPSPTVGPTPSPA